MKHIFLLSYQNPFVLRLIGQYSQLRVRFRAALFLPFAGSNRETRK